MFNERAATYDQSALHHWLAERSVSQCALPPGGVCLDAAAGTELASRKLLDHAGKNGTFILADISEEILRLAKTMDAETLIPIKSDVASLPIDDACVDLILCVSAFSYFANPVDVLHEFRRVVKPKGRLVFQVFQAGTMFAPYLFRKVAQQHSVTLTDPNGFLGSREACLHALDQTGFEQVSIREEIWRETMPDGQRFFAQMIGIMSHVFESVPQTTTEAMCTDFLDTYEMARDENGPIDEQAVYFVEAQPMSPQ